MPLITLLLLTMCTLSTWSSDSTQHISSDHITLSAVSTDVSSTTVQMIRADEGPIAASDVVNIFMRGWRYQRYVEVLGYTATDDLWTVVKRSHISSNVAFDEIRIDVRHLHQESNQWHQCIKAIELASRAFSYPMITIIN